MADQENNDPTTGLPKPAKPFPSPVRSEYDRDEEALEFPMMEDDAAPSADDYQVEEIDIEFYEEDDGGPADQDQ